MAEGISQEQAARVYLDHIVEGHRREIESYSSLVHQMSTSHILYADRVRTLVENLVKARNLQPVDDAILQDIDDAIDELVKVAGIVLLVEREG